MGCKSPPTNLVEPNEYGISGVMGYRVHGLREFRLYTYCKDAAAMQIKAQEQWHKHNTNIQPNCHVKWTKKTTTDSETTRTSDS